MESFIPQKSPREERPGGDAGEELSRTFSPDLTLSLCSSSFFPETFIFLLILCSIRSINKRIAIKVPDSSHQIGQHRLREFYVLERVKGRLRRKNSGELLFETR